MTDVDRHYSDIITDRDRDQAETITDRDRHQPGTIRDNLNKFIVLFFETRPERSVEVYRGKNLHPPPRPPPHLP